MLIWVIWILIIFFGSPMYFAYKACNDTGKVCSFDNYIFEIKFYSSLAFDSAIGLFSDIIFWPIIFYGIGCIIVAVYIRSQRT